MDYDKLIERLSRYSEPVIAYKLDADFADAVTETAAELRGKCAGCSVPATTAEMIRDLNDAPKLRHESEQLRADLARVTAERDAAISDLTYIARTYPVELCDDLVCRYCKHYPNIDAGCPGWTDDDCFEWRGIKKEV